MASRQHTALFHTINSQLINILQQGCYSVTRKLLKIFAFLFNTSVELHASLSGSRIKIFSCCNHVTLSRVTGEFIWFISKKLFVVLNS